MPATDPALWTTRHAFGVAGGLDEVVLTEEGRARAWSVGAQVRRGSPAEALEALSLCPEGSGLLVQRIGARMQLTQLGRFDQIAWGHLRKLSYVESWQDVSGNGVRLTLAGHLAVERGHKERVRLLARCLATASGR